MGDMERWEDMPAVLDGLERRALAAYVETYRYPTTDAERLFVQRGIDAMRYAVAVEPVAPVRVLRDWIADQLHDRDQGVRDLYDQGARAMLGRLSRVLDDYEKENPNG